MANGDLQFVLDTSVCIRILRGGSRIVHRIEQMPVGATAMSAITLAELAAGLARRPGETSSQIDALMARVPVLPFDVAAAKAFPAARAARGKFDRLIAAHALALDVTLATTNARDFRIVTGLRIADWTH
ncbi:PIN domain-containing protein [Sphingosinithalassobacter portus]|uniref:PIN domain-containing protein n=1 Tax=Stakelama portus TaxID=2676234 RepID=UPI000D6E3A50|nr:PIN domain-containing protein [Sphingosinithalassobacter portus]